jgi:hypothetical protein
MKKLKREKIIGCYYLPESIGELVKDQWIILIYYYLNGNQIKKYISGVKYNLIRFSQIGITQSYNIPYAIILSEIL